MAVGNVRYLSNKSAYIAKMRRPYYLKTYPTVLVEPNGVIYTIRYEEPRRIITLPLNLESLSPEQQQEILEARKPKQKVKYVELEATDTFDANKYVKYVKKKK